MVSTASGSDRVIYEVRAIESVPRAVATGSCARDVDRVVG